MSDSESQRGPFEACCSFQERIRVWLAKLSSSERVLLSAQWWLRKRHDAAKKLEELFSADSIEAFQAKIQAFAIQLGGDFAQNERMLMSMLYVYMVNVIPENIRTETRELVDAALEGRPVVRG